MQDFHRFKNLVLAVVLFTFSVSLYGSSVLVGAGPNPYTSAFCNPGCYQPAGNFGSGIEQAVEFSLSGSAFASTIDVSLFGFVTGENYTLSLVSALTGPSTTYGSFNLTTTGNGGTFGAGYLDLFSLDLNQDLNAGTYYLVLSSTTQYDGGWLLSDDTLTQNAGAVADGTWASSTGGATWAFNSATTPTCAANKDACPYTPIFALNGPASTVPEPASLILLGTGALGLFGPIQRKLHRRR